MFRDGESAAGEASFIVTITTVIATQHFYLSRVVNMTRSLLIVAVAAMAVTAANAFVAPPSVQAAAAVPTSRPLMAVLDVDSEAEFDKKITSAGSKLVVIDYSTTWCGPCKVIAPKFDQLSDAYPDSIFIKVRSMRRSVQGTSIDIICSIDINPSID